MILFLEAESAQLFQDYEEEKLLFVRWVLIYIEETCVIKVQIFSNIY